MPHTGRKDHAKLRASYTQEHRVAAQAGVNRRDLGFDCCTTAQLELRTLLARHIFNAGAISAVKWSNVARMTCYDVVMSPRYNDLEIITIVPDNVAACLVNDSTLYPGVAGLRVESVSGAPGRRTYRMVHLPSGAHMSVTSERRTSCRTDTSQPPSRIRWVTPDVALSSTELEFLDALEPMPRGIAAITSALVTRLNVAHPQGLWSAGTWFNHPMGCPRPQYVGPINRRLTDGASRWSLQWSGYPYIEDIVAMLTDEHVGLEGLKVSGGGSSYDLHLQGSTLRLETVAPRY